MAMAIRVFLLSLLFLSFADHSFSLYEDQAGLMDWYKFFYCLWLICMQFLISKPNHFLSFVFVIQTELRFPLADWLCVWIWIWLKIRFRFLLIKFKFEIIVNHRHQQYIGKVKHAVFHTQKTGKKRVVVSTEENVLASLDLRHGQICMWGF